MAIIGLFTFLFITCSTSYYSTIVFITKNKQLKTFLLFRDNKIHKKGLLYKSDSSWLPVSSIFSQIKIATLAIAAHLKEIPKNP